MANEVKFDKEVAALERGEELKQATRDMLHNLTRGPLTAGKKKNNSSFGDAGR